MGVMNKIKTILISVVGITACTLLTSCGPDPEPESAPKSESELSKPYVDDGSQWKLSKLYSHNIEYDEFGRIINLYCTTLEYEPNKILKYLTVNGVKDNVGVEFKLDDGKIIVGGIRKVKYQYSDNFLVRANHGNSVVGKDYIYDFSWKNGVLDKISAHVIRNINEEPTEVDFDIDFEYSDNLGINSSCIKSINALIMGSVCLSDLDLENIFLLCGFYGELPDKLISKITWGETWEPWGDKTLKRQYFYEVSEIDSNGCPMCLSESSLYEYSPNDNPVKQKTPLGWKRIN